MNICAMLYVQYFKLSNFKGRDTCTAKANHGSAVTPPSLLSHIEHTYDYIMNNAIKYMCLHFEGKNMIYGLVIYLYNSIDTDLESSV